MSHTEVQSLGRRTNVDVLREHVQLDHKFVVDAGCGSLTFTNLLAEEGAQVLAIDPDPIQAKLNRESGFDQSIQFEECGADSIPAADHSVDGVFFSYSLHHIPTSLHGAVFREARRVLKHSGFIYIIEPVDCPLNQVMKLFHNEDVERAEAWDSIVQFGMPMFQHGVVAEYFGIVNYESWDAFKENFGRRSYNPGYSYEDVACEAVRDAFEVQARRTESGYEFDSPKRIVFLSGIK
ncbi:MAG: class I SAM-dependent methyltransferase [Planctomycetota bacterium]